MEALKSKSYGQSRVRERNDSATRERKHRRDAKGGYSVRLQDAPPEAPCNGHHFKLRSLTQPSGSRVVCSARAKSSTEAIVAGRHARAAG